VFGADEERNQRDDAEADGEADGGACCEPSDETD